MTQTTSTHPSNRPVRSLHLVDLENLAMDPDPSDRVLDEALSAYHSLVPPSRADLVILSASTRLSHRIAFHVERLGRLLPAGGGPNAADLALLGEAPVRWVVERFDRLVIVSGDGIFSDLSDRVRRAGREVCVASWRAPLSRRLTAAASNVCILDNAYGAAA